MAKNGNDTEGDGSLGKPYLTLTKAFTVATAGQLVMLAPGTYAENVTIPAKVSLRGAGTSGTILDGNLATTAASQIHIYGLLVTGSVTLNTPVSLIDSFFAGAVTVSGAATIQAWNTHFVPSASGVTPITMTSTGKLQIVMSSITSQGDVPAVNQSNGMLIFELCQLSGSRAANPILNSTAGIVNLINCYVLNYGGGSAASLNNGATTTPNAISGVFAVGSVACGTAAAIVEALAFASGSLTGSAFVFRPASRIANDSTIAGATVKDALDAINLRLIAGGL